MSPEDIWDGVMDLLGFGSGSGEDMFPEDYYGTKVLYRPDDYDYDLGSGGADGSGQGENDYYGKYAYAIISDLVNVYGLANQYTLQDRVPLFNPNYTGLDEKLEELSPFFYDSIRYKYDTIGVVTHSYEVTMENGSYVIPGNFNPDTDTVPLGEENHYTIYGADESVKWNWSVPAKISEDNSELLNAYMYQDNVSNVVITYQNTHVYSNIPYVNPDQTVNTFYGNDESFNDNLYQQLFLGSKDGGVAGQEDYANYSDMVKTLEYVIYCYAVDLEPAQVTIRQTNSFPYYSITIGSFESVDSALQTAKETFEILGTYVGLVSRQITRIQNWITENIIGSNAIDNGDDYYVYTPDAGNVGVIVLLSNGMPVGYLFEHATMSRIDIGSIGRDYENVVENIVDGVCELVPIGKNDDDSDLTIDQRFLASNVMEYAGSTFNITDDSSFPVYDENNPIHQYAIRPLEYQSVVLMFKELTYVEALWIALKYDPDNSGTDDGVYNRDNYIEMIVDLNYYNHLTRTRRVVQSKRVKVYEGPYEIDYIYGEGDGRDVPEDHFSGVVFEDLNNLQVNVFNTEIGNGILKTDVGREGGYTDLPVVSEEPLILVGTTNLRRYYEIVEPGSSVLDNENLAPGYTYTSGRLNPEMFSGSDGCDYIEITYKVIKRAGDMTTNYKFYTGLQFMDASNTPY